MPLATRATYHFATAPDAASPAEGALRPRSAAPWRQMRRGQRVFVPGGSAVKIQRTANTHWRYKIHGSQWAAWDDPDGSGCYVKRMA